MNPDRLAGQNIGAEGPDVRPGATVAADVKELTRDLEGFTLEELRHIPVLPPGARLKQGATYMDVSDPSRPVVHATGNLRVLSGHYLVPKHGVSYEAWNRLAGIPPR
jgi:hypothetical protein